MDIKIDDSKPYEEVVQEEKKLAEKRVEITEKIAEMECDICDMLISINGISPEPRVCKVCYEKMIKGEKLNE